MINVYDFDKTIYDGDSSIDFYFFCLRKKVSIITLLPIQIFAMILYLLKIKDKEYLKQKFYIFLNKIDDIDEYISEFWKENIKKVKPWYIDNKKNSDVIISASPEFLLKPLEKKLKINKIIASKVDKNTGKLLSKNCHDVEKTKRFYEEVGNKKIKHFYSDSMSDKPMMDIAEEAFLVNRDEMIKINLENSNEMKKYIRIDKLLISMGILFLVIPITIQLFFWYNRLISIPCIILLLIATIIVIKKIKPLKIDEYKKIFNKKKIIVFIILIIILNLLSGAGGLFHQNWDYHGRNAIFHDLIEHSWPVRYDYSNLKYESGIFGNSAILNYYFAFWLPGALIGKVLGFKIASLFMLLWQTIGVLLFFYLVIRFMKNIKYRYFLIFLAFGGLNVIGHIIMNIHWGLPVHPIGTTHIDTSMGSFCMSTFVTQLFWVFNQSIPTWIAVMLFLQEKNYKTCGYYFALLVPFGPFPMLGFLYLIFCYIIFGKKLDKFINIKRIKELITIPNFFACISVIPIVFMYTLNESKKGMFLLDAYNKGTLKETLFCYIMFIILEFLIYIVIINRKNYKQIIMCFLFFTIAPLFYIGGSDLGNRATIPLLIVMYLLIITYLDKINHKDKKQNFIQKVLIIILLVASITNYNEIYRSFKHTYLNHKNHQTNVANAYKTFDSFKDKECSIFITNFVAKDDKKNKILQFILRK